MNPAAQALESFLFDLPWQADPDTFTDPDGQGITLAGYLADSCRGILLSYQSDTLGDSYDQDLDAIWTAVMDGSIETAGEALAYIMNLPDHDA